MPRFLLLFLSILSFISPASADGDTHYFGFYVKGLKAGTIHTQGTTFGMAYSVTGSVQPTSLMKKFRDIGYAGFTTGAYGESSFEPRTYHSQTKTGSRTSQVKMRFNKGSPFVDEYAPSRERRDYDIDPATQIGSIDPLSAAHQVFRDQKFSNLCAKTLRLFDGRRVTRLSLEPPLTGTDGATCTGTYTRVAGFSPLDMQEQVNFPFTLVYRRVDDDLYRLVSFTAETSFGAAKAVRK